MRSIDGIYKALLENGLAALRQAGLPERPTFQRIGLKLTEGAWCQIPMDGIPYVQTLGPNDASLRSLRNGYLVTDAVEEGVSVKTVSGFYCGIVESAPLGGALLPKNPRLGDLIPGNNILLGSSLLPSYFSDLILVKGEIDPDIGKRLLNDPDTLNGSIAVQIRAIERAKIL